MRHNFNSKTKRILAQRAGYRCSICRKTTVGPTSDSAYEDGDAAHITAASPKGPPRGGIQSNERAALDNGIWVCTQHHRLIDRDVPYFTTKELRHYRELREFEARTEQEGKASFPYIPSLQDTARAVELSDSSTRDDLFDIVTRLPYNSTAIAALTDILTSCERPTRVLRLAETVILENWKSNTHEHTIGLLVTLLTKNLSIWRPTKSVIGELNRFCTSAINDDNWSRVASVQPLAFALGAKGCGNTLRSFIQVVIEEENWRREDLYRNRENFYGNDFRQLVAFAHHWNDRFRSGLLRAHDVGLALEMLLSPTPDVRRPKTRQRLVMQIKNYADVLKKCGEHRLVTHVVRQLDLDSSGGCSG